MATSVHNHDQGGGLSAGEEVGLSFSLLYAAPETVAAFTSGKRAVFADTAVDTFAFGVMCFELLTRKPFYPKGLSGSDVGEMLAGLQPMPHEELSAEADRQLGALKRCALPVCSSERCVPSAQLHRNLAI